MDYDQKIEQSSIPSSKMISLLSMKVFLTFYWIFSLPMTCNVVGKWLYYKYLITSPTLDGLWSENWAEFNSIVKNDLSFINKSISTFYCIFCLPMTCNVVGKWLYYKYLITSPTLDGLWSENWAEFNSIVKNDLSFINESILTFYWIFSLPMTCNVVGKWLYYKYLINSPTLDGLRSENRAEFNSIVKNDLCWV